MGEAKPEAIQLLRLFALLIELVEWRQKISFTGIISCLPLGKHRPDISAWFLDLNIVQITSIRSFTANVPLPRCIHHSHSTAQHIGVTVPGL